VAENTRWVWEAGTGRYRNLDTGRFIGQRQVVQLVNGIVDNTEANPVTLLNTMLADGRVNTAEWKTGFARQIKNAYIQQAELAAGGRSQMTPQLWGMVGGSVREQYGYLDDFAQEIADGKLTAGQINSRTKMYVNSSREAYWRVKDAKARTDGFTEEKWNAIGDDSTCGPCADADTMGWQPVGTFAQPGSGRVRNRPRTDCQGLTNCRCEKEYRGGTVEAEQEPPTQPVEPEEAPEYDTAMDETVALFKRAQPDASDSDIEYYIEVMKLDKERFKLYAEKLGLQGDIDDLAARFFKEEKELSRKKAKSIWDNQEARALHKKGKVAYNQGYSEKLDQELSTSRGRASIEEVEDRGFIVLNESGESESRIRRELEVYLNVLDHDPVVSRVAEDQVRGIAFVRDRRPGDTASASYDPVSKMIQIYPHRGYDMPAGTWTHEIGHAAESYASNIADRGFGSGNVASMYGDGRFDEDWAELFTAARSDIWTIQEIAEWMPDKYQYMISVIPGM
jgi:hypothetical protein